MPWYIVNSMSMHLKLSGKAAKNPPAQCCARVEIDGRQQRCMGVSSLLCDHPVEGGTCDAPLCVEHANQVGPDRHLCRAHNLLRLLAVKELF